WKIDGRQPLRSPSLHGVQAAPLRPYPPLVSRQCLKWRLAISTEASCPLDLPRRSHERADCAQNVAAVFEIRADTIPSLGMDRAHVIARHRRARAVLKIEVECLRGNFGYRNGFSGEVDEIEACPRCDGDI